jgi:hypothetical protein
MPAPAASVSAIAASGRSRYGTRSRAETAPSRATTWATPVSRLEGNVVPARGTVPKRIGLA